MGAQKKESGGECKGRELWAKGKESEWMDG